MHLIIETGTLTGDIPRCFLLLQSKTLTWGDDLLQPALFLLPSHSTYWQATIGMLGALYANMMMMVLNNRIMFMTHDDTLTSNDFHYPIREHLEDCTAAVYR